MQAATIKKIMQIKDDLGIKVFHVQGDNSNFFSHGILGNEILFDFENEMAIAIRVNKSSNITPYRITMLDFEQIQYITFELDYEDTDNFINNESPKYGATAEDIEIMKRAFKKSKLYKGNSYTGRQK